MTRREYADAPLVDVRTLAGEGFDDGKPMIVLATENHRLCISGTLTELQELAWRITAAATSLEPAQSAQPDPWPDAMGQGEHCDISDPDNIDPLCIPCDCGASIIGQTQMHTNELWAQHIQTTITPTESETVK